LGVEKDRGELPSNSWVKMVVDLLPLYWLNIDEHARLVGITTKPKFLRTFPYLPFSVQIRYMQKLVEQNVLRDWGFCNFDRSGFPTPIKLYWNFRTRKPPRSRIAKMIKEVKEWVSRRGEKSHIEEKPEFLFTCCGHRYTTKGLKIHLKYCYQLSSAELGFNFVFK